MTEPTPARTSNANLALVLTVLGLLCAVGSFFFLEDAAALVVSLIGLVLVIAGIVIRRRGA